MTRDDRLINLLTDWLEEQPATAPDQLLESVLTDVQRAPQRARWRSTLCRLPMFGSKLLRYAAVAVVGLLAVVIAVGVWAGSGGGVGTPRETPKATPTGVLIEPAAVNQIRPLLAGSYYVDNPFPVQAGFAVPDGWQVWAYTPAASQVNLLKDRYGEISLEIVDNVTADPCTGALLDPPVGPSVDDLVTALAAFDEFGFEVSPATDISIDGFRGKQLTLESPSINSPTCEGWNTWRTTTRQNGLGLGELNDVRILDVDGVRLLISVAHDPDQLPAGALTEIQAVVDSLEFSK